MAKKNAPRKKSVRTAAPRAKKADPAPGKKEEGASAPAPKGADGAAGRKRKPSKGLGRAVLLKIHEALLVRLKEIDANLSASWRKASELPRGGDDADIASSTAEIDLSLLLAEVRSSEIDQIEEALGRIAEGTYGLCEVCGGLIEPERLEFLPFTKLCIVHAHERELLSRRKSSGIFLDFGDEEEEGEERGKE